MTVSASFTPDKYTATGDQTDFVVNSAYGSAADLSVIVNDVARTDWSLADATTLRFDSGLTSGDVVYIGRATTVVQDLDLAIGQALNPASLEASLDKLTRLSQEFDERLARAASYKLASDYTSSPVLPEAAASQASRLLGYDSSGLQLTTYSTTAVTSAEFDNIGNYSNNLSTAVTNIGAGNVLLLIDTTVTVSANVSVPSNIFLMFLREGSLSVDSGKTVTVNSGVLAGAWQIFSGSGSVVFGATARVPFGYTEWYGALPDASTDCSAAFTSIAASGLNIIQFFPGTYNTSTPLIPAASQAYFGTGEGGSCVIQQTTTSANAVEITDLGGVILRELELRGGSASGSGLVMSSDAAGVNSCFVQNVRVRNSGAYGIHLKGIAYCMFGNIECSANGSDNIRITGTAFANSSDNCEFIRVRTNSSSGAGGFTVGDATYNAQNLTIIGHDSEANTTHGLLIQGASARIRVFRGHYEGNTTFGAKVNATGAGNTLECCSALQNSTIGFHLSSQAELLFPYSDNNTTQDYEIDSGNSQYIIFGKGDGNAINDNNGTGVILDVTTTQLKNLIATSTVLTHGADETAAIFTSQNTQDVTNSAKTIFTSMGDNGSWMIVTGKKDGASDRFIDIVVGSNNSNPLRVMLEGSVLGLDLAGTPTTRAYTRSSNALQLTMGAADNYNVTVRAYTAPLPDVA